MPGTELRLLYQLARLYGVETHYHDVAGERRPAAPPTLLSVLRALGAPVAGLADVPGALRERRQEKWRRCSRPVLVAWDGEPAHFELSMPAASSERPAYCSVELENGEERHWTCDLASLPVAREATVEGVNYIVRELALPADLPRGYHKVRVATGRHTCESLLIRAPRQVYNLSNDTTGRIWGVFIPLYALHSGSSWGAGNFTDLGNLMHWTQEMGGSLVGTLPLLATFLDEPFDPSPYAPASRLFWNEFYLDVTRIPELQRCPEAGTLAQSPDFQKKVASLQATPLVEYRHGMAVRRSVLEELARCFFAEDSGRQAALRRWVFEKPAAVDYARFRAATDRRRDGWPLWPDRMRDGLLREGDYDPEAERYHLYAQWVAEEQLQALAAETRKNGPGMYLDFPLGVHSAGYDVWREREAFVMSAGTGAPPDALFEEGQDWGFPPLHPERIREQGYRYYIACLRHHLRHAGVLRLDHVMGLHHLFWIPPGMGAREGIYVRYRSAEFYAVLALESHRYKTAIVGEDLGTVPPYVRADMSRHGLHRMYVLPFEIEAESAALRPVPASAAASLNTHDMPPFAASLGAPAKGNRSALCDFLRTEGLLETEADDAASLIRACLAYLAVSKAPLVLVNLEDLWQETEPQNVPGTGVDAPNWRRKARYGLEVFTQMPGVVETLRHVNHLRGPAKAGG